MPLKYPLHFVYPEGTRWPELAPSGPVSRIDGARLSKLSGGILHSWIFRTYYQLALAGEAVTLSASLSPEAINVVSVRDFGRKMRRPDCFLLIPQGDAHPSELADFKIRQNGLFPDEPRSTTIWHWPQPGIIPRDPARGTRIEQLCYKGRIPNLDPLFRADAFSDALGKLGIRFEIDAYVGLRGDHSWNDYSQSDVLLAVRNLTHHDARKKPASKLVNAWIGDIPAILGPEPAYRELREGPLDYIEVKTPQEALNALAALQKDPELYRKMVENGQRRREAFSDAALTQMWVDRINGPVGAAFDAWRAGSRLWRQLKAYRGIALEGFSVRRDGALIRQGDRILD
jgi:hypothetical protein